MLHLASNGTVVLPNLSDQIEHQPIGRHDQAGLFAILPLAPTRIQLLRDEHGICIHKSGRISIAGLNNGNIDRRLAALAG